MTRPVQFNVRKLRKPSQILRKAAEIIQHDLKTRSFIHDNDLNYWNQYASLGGCHALDDVADAVESKIDPEFNYMPTQRLCDFNDQMYRARDLFQAHFGWKDTPRRSTRRSGYWFGKLFKDNEQQHRIDALLWTAEIAEAQGE